MAKKKKEPNKERRSDGKEEAPAGQVSEPDWGGKCEVCGASPIVPETGLCGPCTWGDADTIGGNW